MKAAATSRGFFMGSRRAVSCLSTDRRRKAVGAADLLEGGRPYAGRGSVGLSSQGVTNPIPKENSNENAVESYGALALSSAAFAEEAAPAEAPAADGAAAPAVQISATADQVVKVNTGNETVDAVANLAAKCAERSAAFRVCDGMVAFRR